MIKTRTLSLALDVGDSGALPTEFRLFVKGWNETENGRFLFDDAAAKAVMSAYREWGVDLMIDLEHQSLEVEPGSADPTARDARGWCRLELRADGSLWAVQVRWTPDGASRLTNKTQRYVSPAFETDPKTKRVLKMINVAITSIPATHHTPALVAASLRGNGMDPEMVKKALEALQAGDDEAATEILKSMIAAAASGGAAAEGDAEGSEGDGAEGVAPRTENAEDPEVVQNDAADGDGEDDEDSEKPEKKAARKVLRAALCRITGKKTFAEAVAEVDVYKASHVELETERQKLAREREVLESADRRKLVTELIRLGAEFPATVWADPTAQKPVKLKARWAKMPIAELRSHVDEQRAARGKKPEGAAGNGLQPPRQAAPTSADPDISTLSADELRYCKEAGADPKDYALLKARRDGATAQEGGR